MSTNENTIEIRLSFNHSGDLERTITLNKVITVGRQREQLECFVCRGNMIVVGSSQPGTALGRSLGCMTCGARHLELTTMAIPHLHDYYPDLDSEPVPRIEHVPEQLLVISRASLGGVKGHHVVVQCRASQTVNGVPYDYWRIRIIDPKGSILSEARRTVGVLVNDSDHTAVLEYLLGPFSASSEVVLKARVIRQEDPRSSSIAVTRPPWVWSDAPATQHALQALKEAIFPNGRLLEDSEDSDAGHLANRREWSVATAFFALQQQRDITKQMEKLGVGASNFRRPGGLWNFLDHELQEAKTGLHFDSPFGLATILGQGKREFEGAGGSSACFDMISRLLRHGVVPQAAVDQIKGMLEESDE